jgi:hypothetical protein
VGLPRRHARRARARGVHRVGRDRLGHRSADGDARRPVRAGHGPAVDRPGRERRPGRAGPQPGRATAPDGRLRRRRQQRRPQDRPPAPGGRRAPVRVRSRGHVLRGLQAAYRLVAVARQGAAPAVGRGAAPPLRRHARRWVRGQCARGRLASRRTRQAPDPRRGPGNPVPRRPAAQAPGSPVPARRLARHPLAAGLISFIWADKHFIWGIHANPPGPWSSRRAYSPSLGLLRRRR